MPPKLPEVSPEGVRAPLLNAGDDPQAFGVGFGVAINRTAGVLSEIGRQKIGANVTEAMGAYNEGVYNILRDPSVDDTGKTNGLLYRKLKDAEGISKEADERLDKLAGQVSSGLKSDAEKLLFREHVLRQRPSERNVVSEHESAQIDDYNQKSAALLISSATQLGAEAPMDGQLHADNVDHITSAIKLQWGSKLTPEQLATVTKQEVSHYYRSVIESLPDENVKQAQMLLTAHHDDLTAEDRKKLSKDIEVQNTRDEAQAAADKAWAKSKGDLGQSLDLVGAIGDERIRNSAEARVRQLDADAKASLLQDTNKDVDAIRQVFALTGGLSKVPRDLYARVARDTPEALIALQNMAASRAKVQPDPDLDAIGKYYELTPAEMALPENAPWIRLQGKASDSTIQQLAAYRGQILNDQRNLTRLGSEKKGPPATAETVESRIKAYGDQLKLTTRDRGALDIYVWKQVQEYQSLNEGKNPPQDELNKIMDRAILQGDMNRAWLPDTKVRAFRVKPEDAANFTPGTLTVNVGGTAIPEDELTLIDAAIIGKHLTPDTETRLQFYRWRHP